MWGAQQACMGSPWVEYTLSPAPANTLHDFITENTTSNCRLCIKPSENDIDEYKEEYIPQAHSWPSTTQQSLVQLPWSSRQIVLTQGVVIYIPWERSRQMDQRKQYPRLGPTFDVRIPSRKWIWTHWDSSPYSPCIMSSNFQHSPLTLNAVQDISLIHHIQPWLPSNRKTYWVLEDSGSS